jgi:sugar lactone lactonase YvrE
MPTPDGGLYFSDVNENRTYKLDRAGKIAIWRENTNRTNGLYLLKDGRLLCAEGNGPRIISVSPDGKVNALATSWKEKPLRQPNDLIPDRNRCPRAGGHGVICRSRGGICQSMEGSSPAGPASRAAGEVSSSAGSK